MHRAPRCYWRSTKTTICHRLGRLLSRVVADIRHLLAELVFGATVSSESVRERAQSEGVSASGTVRSLELWYWYRFCADDPTCTTDEICCLRNKGLHRG